MNDLLPDSKAVAEVAKAGGKISDTVGKGVDAGTELGRFLAGSSLKSIPRAIVSILGGDWIIGKQVENIIKIQHRIHETALERGLQLDPQSLPWRIKVEAIRGMADEDDEVLQQEWANILISAMSKEEKFGALDRLVLDTFKRLSPVSARMLLFVAKASVSGTGRLYRGKVVRDFSDSEDISLHDAAMTMDHLSQLRCAQHHPVLDKDHITSVTALGRDLVRRMDTTVDI